MRKLLTSSNCHTIAKCALCLVLVCALLFSLTACCLTYKFDMTDSFGIGYSKREKRAYFADYFWNGDKSDMTIVVPDTYKDLPVRDLGGYYGTGVPCPFGVTCLLDFDGTNYISSNTSFGDEEYETLVFTVVLGSNISRIVLGGEEVFWGVEYEDEDGNLRLDMQYKIAYYFEVVDTNRTFYALDGKLYNKSDNSLVNWDFSYA